MSSIDIYTHPHYTTLQQISKAEIFISYIDLCIKYKDFAKVVGKTESHHIFPVAIFGDNDIRVNFPIKEHFNAHVLLWKMIDKSISLMTMMYFRKMANAVHKMVQGRKKVAEFTADEYELARLAIVDARTNMVTAYDVRENKNVKVMRDLVDNKRYFRLFPMQDTIKNKACFISVMDPAWIDCVPRPAIQAYIDTTTGNTVKLDTKIAMTSPDRYVHNRTGKVPNADLSGRARKFFDVNNAVYINCTSEHAKQMGYVGCSNYIDLENNNAIVYISTHEAKQQPWRYKHANSGRFDAIVIATGECVKIYSHEFDRTKYVARSKGNNKKKSNCSTKTLDFGD